MPTLAALDAVGDLDPSARIATPSTWLRKDHA